MIPGDVYQTDERLGPSARMMAERAVRLWPLLRPVVAADDVAWFWAMVAQAVLAKDVLELARRGSALAARP
jgi:hypothetical protein